MYLFFPFDLIVSMSESGIMWGGMDKADASFRFDLCGAAWLGAGGRASSEFDVARLPVDEGVVSLEPVGTQDDVLISDVSDIEFHVFFVIGGSIRVVEADTLDGVMIDVTKNILSAVNVSDGEWFGDRV